MTYTVGICDAICAKTVVSPLTTFHAYGSLLSWLFFLPLCYVHFCIVLFIHNISSLACSLIAPYLHSISDKDTEGKKNERRLKAASFPR